jgi:ATP-dependent RNA helicase DDX35
MKKRADLKLIICSATVDADEIFNFFDEGSSKKTKDHVNSLALKTQIISVEGRYYPIEISYLSEACDNYLKACVSTAFAIHMTQEDNDGDILVS